MRPQVNGSIDYLHNFNLQNIILENGAIPAFSSPQVPDGAVLAFPLQLKNSLVPSLTATQVVFSEALFANKQTAQVYEDLAQKNVTRSQVDVIEAVTKAYYSVLVNQKQLGFIEANLSRMDTIYRDSKFKFDAGVIRRLDLDRVEVSYNNLKEEHNRVKSLLDLSKALLAYQMNYDGNLVLADALNEADMEKKINQEAVTSQPVDASSRIEYSILQSQEKLSLANINTIRAGYYPSVGLFATTGYNPAATHVGDIFQGDRWLNYTYAGIRVNVPVFDGLSKKYRIQEATLEHQKLGNNMSRLSRSINLEVQRAQINLQNSLHSLQNQKRNLELANKDLDALKYEYEKGVVANIELTNAETSLKEAQTNYYNALYNALIAKVDLDKALGKLSL
jgi:outer membrane protein TolC